jgi:uncharacterized protein
MPRSGLFISVFVLFLLCGNVRVPQAEGFTVPSLRSAVTDQAGMLSPATRSHLENTLQTFRDQGGAQIAVLTVPSLFGLSIEQASIQIVDQWKLGGRESDDGVLLLIAKQERKIRIEVGQGLEGVLPDAYAKRIIDEGISPLFREGDIEGGVLVGVYQIAQRTNPEINLRSLLEGRKVVQRKRKEGRPWISLLIFFCMIAPFNLMNMGVFGGSRRMRGRGGYYWGGHGGGGFGGGGGFSGGGGGFSGGGASGGW